MANRQNHSPERVKEKAPSKPSLKRKFQEMKIRIDSRLKRKSFQREIGRKQPSEKLKSITYREGEVYLEKKRTTLGRLQRALRFENLTKAVEKRYGIPDGLLLAMMMHESYGDPMQPNEKIKHIRAGGKEQRIKECDGGLGLIHMQPYWAKKYGLRQITPSEALRDFSQGKKILRALEETNYDLLQLIEKDDRFHPMRNIDTAAKILREHYEYFLKEPAAEQRQYQDRWNYALNRYAGRPFVQYGKSVRNFHQTVVSPLARKNAAKKFLRANGISFEEFLKRCHEKNRKDFWLPEYSSAQKRSRTAAAEVKNK